MWQILKLHYQSSDTNNLSSKPRSTFYPLVGCLTMAPPNQTSWDTHKNPLHQWLTTESLCNSVCSLHVLSWHTRSILLWRSLDIKPLCSGSGNDSWRLVFIKDIGCIKNGLQRTHHRCLWWSRACQWRVQLWMFRVPNCMEGSFIADHIK